MRRFAESHLDGIDGSGWPKALVCSFHFESWCDSQISEPEVKLKAIVRFRNSEPGDTSIDPQCMQVVRPLREKLRRVSNDLSQQFAADECRGASPSSP
jgi:hypothetical protein